MGSHMLVVNEQQGPWCLQSLSKRPYSCFDS